MRLFRRKAGGWDSRGARTQLVLADPDPVQEWQREQGLHAALPTSAPEFEVGYQKQLNQMVPALTPAQRPEARWMIDPIDYVKPLVFDPGDERWKK